MYIRVTVVPNARKEHIEKVDDTTYRIKVREEAKQNQANTRVLEIVAMLCGVARKDVRIISGHRSRTKVISVTTHL